MKNCIENGIWNTRSSRYKFPRASKFTRNDMSIRNKLFVKVKVKCTVSSSDFFAVAERK